MVNLLKIDLIYKFLKLQIETCYVFGPFFIRKDCFTIAIVKVALQTTGVVFVSTELLTWKENSAFTFAMTQYERAKILVGLQLCWPSFVYDY